MILAHALDGCLRIRQLNDRHSVVEVRSPYYPEIWTYAAWTKLPTPEAWELFHNQCAHHVGPRHVVQKGR